MPPATAAPSTAAITGFDSASRDGPIGPRENAPWSGKASRPASSCLNCVRVGQGCRVFEIIAGAERTPGAPEDGHAGVWIRIEIHERFHQQIGGRVINGIARVDAIDDDRGDEILLLGSDCHRALPMLGTRATPLRHYGL